MRQYYLYQIKNKINNKIYIGVHQTDDINDGYMGSGTEIRKAIKKYGKDNFEKEILEYFDNEDDMYAREMEIVTEEFIARKDTYNVSLGGTGMTSEKARQLSRRNWNDPKYVQWYMDTVVTEDFREEHRKYALERYSDPEFKERWLKTVQSEEYRKKISEITKEKLADPEIRKKLLGERRPQEYLNYLSDLFKEKWKDSEYQKHISDCMKNTWKDPEYLKKMDERNKKMWRDPEYRKNISEKRKLMWQDPEYRKKISESRSGRKVVHNDELKMNKKIKIEELDEFLKNNPGWEIGQRKYNKK